MRPYRLLAGLTLALVAGPVVTGSPAAAGTPLPTAAPAPVAVTCGAVLTTSARLTADLDCPWSEGITLAADGITLDLGGHTVASPYRYPEDSMPGEEAGILVRADDVTIRNGRVLGWDPGIKVGLSVPEPGTVPGSATVHGVHLEGNHYGVVAYIGADLTVTHSRFVGNGVAGDVQLSGRLGIESSLAQDNFVGFSAFGTTAPHALTIRGSIVSESTYGVICSRAELVLERTVLVGNEAALVAAPCRGTVRQSVFAANYQHLHLDPPEDTDALLVECTLFTARGGGTPAIPVRPCSG